MHAISDPRYLYCSRVDAKICAYRKEAECRREHGCTKPDCPLEASFGLKVFDERMKAYASAFDLWPLSDGPPQDFP